MSRRSPVASRPPHAEFMQVWEEGYVSTTASFTAMHMQGVAVFTGGELRRADGSIDRERVRAWIGRAAHPLPYARSRLQRAPLGLTPPAWVPVDELDLDTHLVFADAVETLAPARLRTLIGWDEGPLDLSAPLWRLRLTPLDDGRIALGILMHHAGGDALRTMKFLAALTASKLDGVPKSADDPFAGQRAARSVELPGLALRAWWSAGDSAGARVRAYLRKPVVRRARRVAARVTRRFRDQPAPPPTTHSGFRTFDGDAVQARGAELDGTMNDLVVAAAITAASAPTGEPVRVRVPVLRRATEQSRNRVTDAEIVGSALTDPAELVASVRAQLSGTEASDSERAAAREVGYATLVPWLSRARYLAGARLDEVVVLPASLPHDELSTFALLYDGKLSVTVTTQQQTDTSAVLDVLGDALTSPVHQSSSASPDAL
ncbi:wax ester/triacylglycerol synthase family O-acyltransferase [Microbacterium sp. ET2]|uniref:wax ester/triacylglycerol synthase domain-containing protein n=1 Tax=Microbacterium albipurpureum TaxID=3050384 RepID=UPI00259CA926|nr:wax ester/triacylglycerol synthase domain-containing protein [Microbacterium sp. ET2 (Ac-2212)]WJL94763.1 wax ester/triacylglycerol synthase family O-acyltransferase [Microbacterium sp. ET2 (Ac-2212)]